MRHPYAATTYVEADDQDRTSFEIMSAKGVTNKTPALARAVDRDAAAQTPSFRPPSGWSQRMGTAHVIWNGHGSSSAKAHEDQFSDAESWDMQSETTPILDGDQSQSTFGHARITSIGSSIFAGRGISNGARRREAPPPIPVVPSAHLSANEGKSPASYALPSPATDYSSFESGSQYDATEDREEFQRDSVFSVDDNKSMQRWQMPRSDAITAMPLTRIPSRGSSKSAKSSSNQKSAGREEEMLSDSSRRPSLLDAEQRDVFEDAQPAHESSDLSQGSGRFPDGTIIPKMPPVLGPGQDGMRPERPSKNRGRRERSHILSYDSGAQEEMKLATIGGSPDDLKRMSTLGPKLKKNAPAPWELESEDLFAPPRSSLRDALRGSNDGFDKPFSRFKSRPSDDSPVEPQFSRGQPQQSSGLSKMATSSLEQEALFQPDEPSAAASSSLFASQRARSKSISNSAAGMLKGLGLSSSAGPAKQFKLAKAFSRSKDDKKAASAAYHPDMPSLPQGNRSSPSRNAFPHRPYDVSEADPVSPTSPTYKAFPSTTKGSPDLVEAIMATQGKYKSQAYSPTINSGRLTTSPRMGGGRNLPYKKSPVFPQQPQVESGIHPSISMDSQLTVLQATLASEGERRRSSESERQQGQASGQFEDRSETSTSTGKLPRSVTLSKFPVGPECSFSSSSGVAQMGGLPMPGSYEGVQYKLISLEQAREKAKMRQSSRNLAPLHNSRDNFNGPSSPLLGAEHGNSMKSSPSAMSIRSSSDDHGPSSKGKSSDAAVPPKTLKNKKSSFRRMLKKDKSADSEAMALPNSHSIRDLRNASQSSVMPSFSVTGSETEELDDNADLSTTPALSVRPVSSMFSGFAAEFLDPLVAEAQSGAGTASPALSSGSGTGGLLAPHSPALTFRSHESYRSSATSFEDAQERQLRTPLTTSPVSVRPRVPHISAPPHSALVSGPITPNSADSTASGKMWISTNGRTPSLDAGGSVSDRGLAFHSPATSPITPSFQAQQRAAKEVNGLVQSKSPASLLVGSHHSELRPDANSALDLVGQVEVPEEVRQRAIEIEEQIKQLSQELHTLRTTQMGSVTPYNWEQAPQGSESTPIHNCPCCGCGCSEQRRLQSLNEAAVLKRVGMLDRGRTLKPSPDMGNTGKFGGYTNR